MSLYIYIEQRNQRHPCISNNFINDVSNILPTLYLVYQPNRTKVSCSKIFRSTLVTLREKEEQNSQLEIRFFVTTVSLCLLACLFNDTSNLKTVRLFFPGRKRKGPRKAFSRGERTGRRRRGSEKRGGTRKKINPVRFQRSFQRQRALLLRRRKVVVNFPLSPPSPSSLLHFFFFFWPRSVKESRLRGYLAGMKNLVAEKNEVKRGSGQRRWWTNKQ